MENSLKSWKRATLPVHYPYLIFGLKNRVLVNSGVVSTDREHYVAASGTPMDTPAAFVPDDPKEMLAV